ncbi:MAG: hypothetical protein NT164_01165 [Verrucomicrobiae bacterium]|nr:hypothetical protein [Verrucomicrobiae bacterium]
MKAIPPISAIVLLIGTTFSLQAIPMFGEGEYPARPESRLAAEQKEEAGRRISESPSRDENQESDLPRQDQMPEIQDPSMEHASISSSGTAGAETERPIPTSAEQEHLQDSGPAAAEGSFEGHSVAAAQPNHFIVLLSMANWKHNIPRQKNGSLVKDSKTLQAHGSLQV